MCLCFPVPTYISATKQWTNIYELHVDIYSVECCFGLLLHTACITGMKFVEISTSATYIEILLGLFTQYAWFGVISCGQGKARSVTRNFL